MVSIKLVAERVILGKEKKKMVQTRIEEKLESFDQEMLGIKKEIRKLPTIEKTLNELTKNMEIQHQMMLVDLSISQVARRSHALRAC